MVHKKKYQIRSFWDFLSLNYGGYAHEGKNAYSVRGPSKEYFLPGVIESKNLMWTLMAFSFKKSFLKT